MYFSTLLFTCTYFLDFWNIDVLCAFLSISLMVAIIVFQSGKSILTLRNKSCFSQFVYYLCLLLQYSHLHSVIHFFSDLGGCLSNLYMFIYKCANTKLWIFSLDFQLLIVSSWLAFILKFNAIACNIFMPNVNDFLNIEHIVWLTYFFSSNLLSRDDEVTYKICFLPPAFWKASFILY